MNNPKIPDAMQIASRLGAALQVQTISFDKDSPKQPFLEMHRLLEAQYPLVHRHLKREIINELSLLYTWQGTQADLAPVAFLAHMDVVPADASDWTHPPFSGEVADGFLYGRGVIDMKSQLVTLLEAVEALLEAGFSPRRTIHLAFGHDEEIGGMNGARAIAETLQRRGTRLEALLDEGGGVAGGVALGIPGLIAIIACAEKSFANVRLEAAARAGHASMPGKTGAIGILSRAITRLERNPMPASLEFVRPTIRSLALRLPLPMRLLFSNLWLSGGLVKMALGRNAITNAMLRNTIAPTILQGGYKSNVLPEKASAVLNCRLLPGVEVEALLAHIRRVIQDERITVTCTDTSAPSRRPVSTDTPYYHDLEAVIAAQFENIPTSPMLLVGATDARQYQGLCERTYRFQPVLFKTAVEDRTHGVDERLEVEQLPRMVAFNAAMMQSWGSRGQEG